VTASVTVPAVGAAETPAAALSRLLAETPEPATTKVGVERARRLVLDTATGRRGSGRIDGWTVLQLGRSSPAIHEPFRPTPARCRRAIGLRAVRAGMTGRFPTPITAVDAVLDDVARRAIDGTPMPWWGAWWRALPPPAAALVRAEAITWATRLWFALEWERLAAGRSVIGHFGKWRPPGAAAPVLRASADVVWSTDDAGVAGTAPRPDARRPAIRRAAALLVGSGACPPRWSTWLAWPALVAALASAERPTWGRVVGWWPDSGQVRVLDIDDDALGEAAGVLSRVRSPGRCAVVSPGA